MKKGEYMISFNDGIFKDHFIGFINFKKSLGYKYSQKITCVLNKLNNRLNELKLKEPVLSRVVIEDLAARVPEEAPATQMKRISLLRHFALFMVSTGHDAYVYPQHYNVRYSNVFSPYIFSHDQIKSILNTSDKLKYNPKSPYHHIIWPAFIRVLYACGLRLSETIHLQVQNVDLDNGVLYIDKSKGTSRYVPISLSLKQYLVSYVRQMNLYNKHNYYFFPAPDKSHYSLGAAQKMIKKIYMNAKIPKLSNGRLPRIHDLRHTFCCHSLEAMKHKGLDLYYSLPILSAYLGHQGIKDTEQYLRLPYFHVEDITASNDIFINGIIPEVLYDEE